MRTTLLQSKLSWLLSTLALTLAFSSCSDKENIATPRASSQADTRESGGHPQVCKSVCLVAGQHNYVGTVDVAKDGGDILVTYNVTAPGVFLKEIHLDVFTSIQAFEAAKKVSNGGAIPGKFDYKQSFSNNTTKSYTVRIPAAKLPNTDCFFIASHAALSNGETAWGGLCTDSRPRTSLDGAKQFPGRNWGVYFEFCKAECAESIDFTYAWEDIKSAANDGDYNDLVIQSDITKSASELKITFLATARGASFDHKFKFKIPKTGVTGIFGEPGKPVPTYTEDGSFFYITVFESTKDALPVPPGGRSSNTIAGAQCVPFAYTEVILTIDNTFPYNPSKPYEPFISVYPSGDVATGEFYDLYLYEVSGGLDQNTWTAANGDRYPNGILIPLDWRWPLENQHITGPYPNFKPMVGSVFTTGWHTPANLALTFNKGACNPPL